MWESAQAIELWIRNLGKSHSSLVKLGVIPAVPLDRLIEDSHSLEVIPCSGIELSFWFESQRFEALHITRISQEPTKAPAYIGSLPKPFDTLRTQLDVRNALGAPYDSREPMSWGEPDILRIGGWDYYELDEDLYLNCQIEIQYSENMEVSLLSFSVMDKES
jgi:hypothetical protein